MINHYINEGIISFLTSDNGIAQDMLTEEEIERARKKNWTHRDLMPLQIKRFLDPDYFKLMKEFKKRTGNMTDCDTEQIAPKRQKRRASMQKKKSFEYSSGNSSDCSADNSDNYGCNDKLGWDTDDDLDSLYDNKPQSSRTTRNNNRRRPRYRKKTRRSPKAVSSKKNDVVSTPQKLLHETSPDLKEIKNITTEKSRELAVIEPSTHAPVSEVMIVEQNGECKWKKSLLHIEMVLIIMADLKNPSMTENELHVGLYESDFNINKDSQKLTSTVDDCFKAVRACNRLFDVQIIHGDRQLSLTDEAEIKKIEQMVKKLKGKHHFFLN